MSRKKFFGMIFTVIAVVSVMLSCKSILHKEGQVTDAFLRSHDMVYAYTADCGAEKTVSAA